MSKEYIAIRDECMEKKKMSKGNKPLTEKEKKECKEIAVKRWIKKHEKPFSKHGTADNVSSKELRSFLLDNEFWKKSGLVESGVLWSRVHTDKEDFDSVDSLLSAANFSESYIKIRVKDSSLFDRFFIENGTDGIVKIVGFNKETAQKEVQSYLFNRDSFNVFKSIKHLVNESKASVAKDSIQWTSAGEIESAFDDHREIIYCQGSVVNDLNKDLLVRAGLETYKVDRDLLPVSFKLVHANTNANKDTFLNDELDSAKATPIHKPIDWQHTDTIIGVMISSTKVDPVAVGSDESVEDSYLHVDGVIYKYKFPTYAAEIQERHEKNNLFFSMEVWFDEAECSTCGAIASSKSDYCEHLKSRFADFSTTSRILRGLTFGGAAVVDNPADKGAISTSLGSNELNNNSKEEGNMPKTETEVVFANDADLEAYVQSRIKEIEDKAMSKEQLKQLEDNLSAAQDEIKSLKEQLEAKEKELTEANEKIEAAKKEFEDFKYELAKDKRLEDRVNELTKAGIKFPEDEEKKKKIYASLREMEDKSYADYKDVVLESLAAKSDPDSTKANDQNDNKPPVDVPNPKNNDDKKYSALVNILDKTSVKAREDNKE